MTASAGGRWPEALRAAARPPVRSRPFWVVQVLAIGIGALYAATAAGLLRPDGLPASATLVLFLLPVLYASVTFGLAGSIATAAWVTVLTLPTLALHADPPARWLGGAELAGLIAVALVAGTGVERERTARRLAESEREAHRAAEARYRALFNTNVAPVLVADRAGLVVEVNAAAARLFGPTALGCRLGDLLPAGPAVGDRGAGGALVSVHEPGGGLRTVRPVESEVAVAGLRQLVLRDVTAEERARGRAAAYAQGVVRAQEEERGRIAAELHDELLQSLVELGRRLELACGSSLVPPSLAPTLGDACRLAAEITGGLRTVAVGLHPPVLDDLGLEPALRGMLADAEASGGLAAGLAVVGFAIRPAPEVELTAFRIAQEAVRNVQRHARASRVVLRLAGRGPRLHLVVADDGSGFAVPAPGAPPQGLGLVGMQERAHSLGGRLRVRSAPGRGTAVAVSLPLVPPAPDRAP